MSGAANGAGGSRRYDLIVIGGGTAGLVSSVIAASIGARVVLIERERTGGDCLWTGCVPSKTLIATARLAAQMRSADSRGLAAADPGVDLGAVMDHVHATIAAIEPVDSPERLRAEGVEVLAGNGVFTDPRTLEIDGRPLPFRAAIVATGSEPEKPPIANLEGEDVSTTDSIWELRELPRRLVVLGGGPVGCELAQAFARLGSTVVIVELADRLLPNEEPEASRLIAERLAADGVELLLGRRASEVRRADGTSELLVGPVDEDPGGEQVARGESVPFDRILLATGRHPRTEGIGLEAAGVRLDDAGAVVADDRLRTSAPGIYAAGDVTAKLPFTHVAAHHARVAVINALFGTRRTVDSTIPHVTFTDPEVAGVGMSVAAARERWGDRVKLARSDYCELDRAITEGSPYGFAQLVGDPKGRLVGATVAAPGGGEAIAELTARVKAGDRIDAVSATVHAYPTLAEGPSRAADDFLRERYSGRTYRALGRLALAARRALDAIRHR